MYEGTLQLAIDNDIKLIVNGGDMCPLKGAEEFMTEYFLGWLAKCNIAGIKNIGMFGNDDIIALLHLLESYEEMGFFERIDGRVVEVDGWKFWGYNYVPDLPFGLKDWVKQDYPMAPSPPQPDTLIITRKGGYDKIDNFQNFLMKRGSIEQDLRNVNLSDPKHTILVTHSPPYGVGLDVCKDGKKVGSKAIMNFIMYQKPVLSLHGHIHESPEITNTWKTMVGETLSVQPGPAPIIVELDESGVEVKYLK